MKKIVFTIIIVLTPFIVETSCTDYLDVVPDNIPTIDHAFNKRYQAEGFLYGLYGFLPYHASVEAVSYTHLCLERNEYRSHMSVSQ